MIKILNEGRGLSFHDWIDVYLQVPEECVIGNYEKDLGWANEPECNLVKPYESYWMRWLQSYRGKLTHTSVNWHREVEPPKIPQVIKEARGIGAWWNPKYIIICDSVSSTSRLGQKCKWGGKPEEVEYGHPYWNDIPRFRRLRPFMENKRQLKFFFQLFSSCPSITPENSYITSFQKLWTPSERHSRDLIHSELTSLLVDNSSSKIICLGNEVYGKVIKSFTGQFYNKDILSLDWPQFYSTWHGHGWRSYREKFCRLICGERG